MNKSNVNARVWLRALAVAVPALVALAANATNIVVNSLADPGDGTTCTLRQAISAANTDVIVGNCAAGQAAPIVDTIDLTALSLTPAAPGTITLAQSSMSDAGALTSLGTPTWLLVITTPMTINGPGSTALTINGGGLGPSPIGLRTLVVSNGMGTVDMPTSISGVSFKEGRHMGGGGGCVFSRESLTLTDVRFESCEAIGNLSSTVSGGALGVNVAGAGDARPNATLTNVRFIGNRAVHGAALPANTSSTGAANFGGGANFVGSVTIVDSQFLGNTAESNGALRIANGTSATITNTIFLSNSATFANVGAFFISAMSGTVTMNQAAVVGNTAALRRGGGLITTIGSAVTMGDAVSITESSFIGNLAGSDIGGLDILTDTFDVNNNNSCNYAQLKNVRLTNVSFEKNLAAKAIGGFRVQCSGNVALSGVEMIANEVFGQEIAGSGGNSAGTMGEVAAVTMDQIRIVGNKTFGGVVITPGVANGGFGVFTVSGPSTLSPPIPYPLTHSFSGSRFLVKDNFAAENEAGVTLKPNGAGVAYDLSDSAFLGNRAKGIASLFLNATGNYTITNSTFSGNIAGNAAGIFINTHANSGTNAVMLAGITNARNGPDTSALSIGSFNPNGPGAATPSATVNVKNAILGQFLFGTGFSPVFAPVIAGVTYAFSKSVVENSVGMPAGACGANGVVCNVDAKLEGLANNGGTVETFTHALRPGSPALDAGDSASPSTYDQRGASFARIVNGTIDIGAFESPVLASVPPCKLDMDGDSQLSALKEGLVLLRAMLGMTGTAVVNGTGISQAQWDLARNNLNANCGTSFAP